MSPIIRLENLQAFQAINLLSDPGHIAGPKIIPNCAMVRLNWQLTDGKVAHNVGYAIWNGTPALSTQIADNIFVNFKQGTNWTTLAAFLAPTLTITGITLLDVRSNTGVEINSTIPSAAGTSTGTALPDESAACVTLRTGNRGQSGRGRFYVPGWASNAVGAGNVIAAGAVTALQNWAQFGWGTQLTAAFGPLALGLPARAAYTSPATGRQFPARAAVAVPVTQILVRDNHWDSQRRRGLR